jgi:hypothetical protein
MTVVAAAEPRSAGFWGLLTDVFLAPARAFAEVARHPRFWAPLLAFTLVQGAFVGVWLERVDILAFARAQAEAAGREPPPAASTDEGLHRVVKASLAVSMLAFTPVLALGMAVLLMFVFNFVLAAEADFPQCLSVASWSLLAVSLVTTPSTLLVMALKEDWNIDPQKALATSADLLLGLEGRGVSRPLLGLAQSVDLVSFWTIFLLAVGMAQVTGRSTATALWAVAGLWVFGVLVKLGFTALF